MYLADEMMLCVKYPEMIGENYSREQVIAIRTDPLSWLNSLPLTEYAHVALMVTMRALGGNHPDQYVTVLYNQLINPVLSRYYKELERYRFDRAFAMRKYDSYLPKEGAFLLRDKMGLCTCRAKSIIRHLCEEYTWLKDEDITSVKLQYWIKEVAELASVGDILNWDSSLEDLVNRVKDFDFAAAIELLPDTATDSQILEKVNALASLFGVDTITESDPYFTEVRDKVNVLISKYNIELMDGTNSYKKLAEKVNELISSLNNQKTRIV